LFSVIGKVDSYNKGRKPLISLNALVRPLVRQRRLCPRRRRLCPRRRQRRRQVRSSANNVMMHGPQVLYGGRGRFTTTPFPTSPSSPSSSSLSSLLFLFFSKEKKTRERINIGSGGCGGGGGGGGGGASFVRRGAQLFLARSFAGMLRSKEF